MAPCYCDEEFFWGKSPVKTADQGMLELVKGILKRSCMLMGGQSWDAFGFTEIEPEIKPETIEMVRTSVRELLQAIHVDKQPQTAMALQFAPRRQLNPNRFFDEAL
jgi:hypothetical protein